MNTDAAEKNHQQFNGYPYRYVQQEKEQHPEDSANPLSSKQLLKRQKLLFLLSLNMLNFRRAIISNRRSLKQRIRGRRMIIRNYYIRHLFDIQTSYILMTPEILRSDIFSYLKKKHAQEHTTEINGHQKNKTLSPLFDGDIVSSFIRSEWLTTFRVSPETYHWLWVQLKDVLKPNCFGLSETNIISLDKQVALGLYTFATGASYSEVAARFKVSKTLVSHFVKRFADGIISVLGRYMLTLPANSEEYDEIRHNFQIASNMPPLVVGVLGQCVLPVNPIADDITIYQKKKDKARSLFLQAIVDDKLLIRKILLEPCHTRLLFEKDDLKLPQQQINGRELPCFIVAPNSSYPLRPWLLHHYDCPSNPHQHDFNDAIEQLLEFKNNAFRRLLGRWHILHRKCYLEPKMVKNIATACCVLHNLVEENDDVYMEHWGRGLHIPEYTNARLDGGIKRDHSSAAEMRDFLARTISSTEIRPETTISSNIK